VVNESGASLANWTTVSGTWATSGGAFANTGGNSAYLRYATDLNLSHVIMEYECLFTAGAGVRSGSLCPVGRAATSESSAIEFKVERDGAGAFTYACVRGRVIAIESGAISGLANDTWFTVRMVIVGSSAVCYVNGNYVAGFVLSQEMSVERPLLGVQPDTSGGVVKFRNVKVWSAAIDPAATGGGSGGADVNGSNANTLIVTGTAKLLSPPPRPHRRPAAGMSLSQYDPAITKNATLRIRRTTSGAVLWSVATGTAISI
jgi:hypothetical protein